MAVMGKNMGEHLGLYASVDAGKEYEWRIRPVEWWTDSGRLDICSLAKPGGRVMPSIRICTAIHKIFEGWESFDGRRWIIDSF